METVKNTTILYVDDDQDDLEMLQEAIMSVDPSYQIVKANNGEEGLARLLEMKLHKTLPCLVVLDINMPKLDGRQTFQRIKADEALSNIPIVIFSTSSNKMDKMFFAGKNVEYITKPIYFPHLLQIAQKLLAYCSP
ncbi:MAG: response regulator [Chitinophagaceae bacterium]|nr:MAG: response regulator [Chitinophagaceae bacterium]